MASKRASNLKPLLRIKKPVKAVVYRAKVRAYESLKYLDLRALSRAAKAEVEIGVIETPAGSPTVVAEIRKGQVVRLGPKECASCLKGHRKAKLAQLKQVISQTGGLKGGVTLPISVARTFGPNGLRIPIGPIVIVIGEPDETLYRVDDHGWNHLLVLPLRSKRMHDDGTAAVGCSGYAVRIESGIVSGVGPPVFQSEQ